jgi:O-antigen biosynthesis protein WbqV
MGTRKYRTSLKIDPLHIVKENILDTWDLFQISKNAKCKLFTITSSIGAEKPTNLMQATLRLAEHYLQSSMTYSSTRSTVVRLFDLIEYKGSILQKIQNNLKSGKRIILNHPEEQRHFITASSAAQIILFATALGLDKSYENNGVFMPFSNGPVKILDIAKLILKEYGLKLGVDVEIEFAQIDEFEKLKQELNLNYTFIKETKHKNIKKVLPSFVSTETDVKDDINEFRDLINRKDRDGVIRKVERSLNTIINNNNDRNKQNPSLINP